MDKGFIYFVTIFGQKCRQNIAFSFYLPRVETRDYYYSVPTVLFSLNDFLSIIHVN
jgi:hypothetical protein